VKGHPVPSFLTRAERLHVGRNVGSPDSANNKPLPARVLKGAYIGRTDRTPIELFMAEVISMEAIVVKMIMAA